jgi:DNA-binding transcriptional LysR family regulator
MLDLDDVRAFTEVIRAGGLTRASARLGMSKSVLSRRLARLEAQLGTPLLARTTRGMSLTEAGADFRPHAERLLAELQAGLDAVSRAGAASGRLRIAAPLSFGLLHLAPVLAELAVRHPRLSIQTAYSDRMVDLVAEGYDVAIRIGNLADSSLVARRIASVRAVMVASPAYLARTGTPRRLEDLDGHEALRLGQENWRFLDGGSEVTIRPHGRFVADCGPALLAGVAAGLGVAMMPAFLANPAIAKGEVVRVLADHVIPNVGLHLLRPPPAADLPNKVKVLTELLVARFGLDQSWQDVPV